MHLPGYSGTLLTTCHAPHCWQRTVSSYTHVIFVHGKHSSAPWQLVAVAAPDNVQLLLCLLQAGCSGQACVRGRDM